MISLQTRLLIAAAIVSTSFLTITGFILYDVFSEQVEMSSHERLIGVVEDIYNKSVDSDEGSMLSPSNQEFEDESELPPVLDDDRFNKVQPEKIKPSVNLPVKKENFNKSGINPSEIKSKAGKDSLAPKTNNATPNSDDDLDKSPSGKPGVDIEVIKKKYAQKQAINKPKGFLKETALYDVESGIYARIETKNNRIFWRSDSLANLPIPFSKKSEPGRHTFVRMLDPSGEEYFALNFTVITEKRIDGKLVDQVYMFQLSESLRRVYNDRVAEFRKKLIQWLGALAITLLLALVLILRWWGLGPMRKVSKELDEIKSGQAQNLSGEYPKELIGLTDGIKTLIVSERAQQQRYRNSLGDLAHSLKTPLAVLSGVTEQEYVDSKEMGLSIREQVERMRQIVDYQLQRAAASGRTTLMTPISVKKSVQRIINTLKKAYADKSIKFEMNIEEQAMFIGDEGDLLELVGNILDNASKMCRKHVKINASIQVNEMHDAGTLNARDQDSKSRLVIDIEDDGPGIPEDKIQGVLKRGFRADQTSSGQGIGLSVVKEIVHAYKGELKIMRSSLGGAKFSVSF